MQWTMRLWGLLWSTRIRAPTVPTGVLYCRSSLPPNTGGALATAAMASGGGTILSVFCRAHT